MIPRFRAWDKSTKVMYDDGDIVDVDIEKKGNFGEDDFL